jgi:hypothetical protein
MTGFFRGPSLMTHVLILGVLEALLVTAGFRLTGSFRVAVLGGLALAIVYVLLALAWASRGR